MVKAKKSTRKSVRLPEERRGRKKQMNCKLTHKVANGVELLKEIDGDITNSEFYVNMLFDRTQTVLNEFHARMARFVLDPNRGLGDFWGSPYGDFRYRHQWPPLESVDAFWSERQARIDRYSALLDFSATLHEQQYALLARKDEILRDRLIQLGFPPSEPLPPLKKPPLTPSISHMTKH